MKDKPAHTYRFARFEFDPGTGELRTDDETVRLAPRPALVLTTLLEEAGGLVTRERLQALLWPNTIVEFDKGLNFCVREVRAALRDSASAPAFIETLPRRGYRFMPEVVRIGDAPGTRAPTGRSRPGAGRARRGVLTRRWSALALGLLVVAASSWLLTRESAFTPPSLDPRARELGEMGGYLLTSGDSGKIARSVDYFRRALAVDPGYARAYAGLGNAYLRLARPGEGKAALHRSLELNPNLWASHVNLALHALNAEYDHGSAAEHFSEALRLAPREVVVQHTAAWYYAATGDLELATDHMAEALALDPVSPRVNGDVGRLYYLAGRHDEAVAHCRRTLELTPEALRPRDCIVQALAEKGALDEARREAIVAMETHQADAHALAAVRSDDRARALEAYWRWAGRTLSDLAATGDDSYVHAAAAWARVGETERALADLDRAYAIHCPVLPQIGLDPALAVLRGEPRFQDLVARVAGGGGD